MKNLVWTLAVLGVLVATTVGLTGCGTSQAPAGDKMGMDKMGMDKMGTDKMGTDKMGTDKMSK